MKLKDEKFCGNLPYSNAQLLKNFHKLERKVLKNKKILEKRLAAGNHLDYLNICIAKLAYEFAKEEKEILFKEIIKRGLIA